jgi:hypothetical protein
LDWEKKLNSFEMEKTFGWRQKPHFFPEAWACIIKHFRAIIKTVNIIKFIRAIFEAKNIFDLIKTRHTKTFLFEPALMKLVR